MQRIVSQPGRGSSRAVDACEANRARGRSTGLPPARDRGQVERIGPGSALRGRMDHTGLSSSASPLAARTALLLALAACGADAPVHEVPAGSHLVQFHPEERRVSLLRAGRTMVEILSDGIELGTVRELDEDASYDPYWLEYAAESITPDPPADLRWSALSGMWLERQSASDAAVGLSFEDGSTAHLEVAAVEADVFHLRLRPVARGSMIAWLRVRVAVDDREAFYGLGEWPDAVEHRGRLRAMQLEPDLGIESANLENRVPIPLVIGTSGWGMFVKSRRPGVFDVARKRADRVEATFGTAEESEAGLEFFWFGAERPIDITRLYYRVTAFPVLPAPWALGPWIWRDESRDQAEIEDDIATIRALDLPTTALEIDRPYATKVNTFDFDVERFPEPARLIKLAHDHGLRLALWHTPYLEEGAEPFLSTALREGYFPPLSGTRLNWWSAPLDLTNAAAVAFWQAGVRRYLDMGIDGFKLDYAEDIVPGFGGGRNEWRFADGSDERTMHYEYTVLYHRLYAQLLPPNAGFLLCRTGRWGDQANVSVIWPGDMDANFAKHRERFVNRKGESVLGVGGLPATVIQGLGLGPSGFPLFAADTGGYRDSPPDQETFVRWLEQTALSPVMVVGDGSSEPPWVFTSTNGRDARTLDLYREYARLHLRLFPYLWSYVLRLPEDGRPIQRAIGLAHPELERHPDDQYLLGEELLVAPVVVRGARSKRVLLPPGEWVDWWSGERHQGPGDLEVEAPLEKLPLFLRAGGAVPLLRPTIDAIAPTELTDRVDSHASEAGPLTVRVALGASGRFDVYDGTTVVVAEHGVELNPGPTYRWISRLEIVGESSAPVSVVVDGVLELELPSRPALEVANRGWFYDPERRTLTVALEQGPHRLERIAR